MSSHPSSHDGEQLEVELLAGCIANPTYAPVAITILGELWAEAWSTQTNRQIAEAIVTCGARLETADLRTVQRWLDVHYPTAVPYLLDQIAGSAIAGLAVEPAATRLREATGIRAARRAAATILENSYETLGEMQAELRQLLGHVNTGSVAVLGSRSLVEQEQNRYERRRAAPGELTGIPTGILALDTAMRGLQFGSVNVVGGRPSHGKSAFAGQIALHAALRNYPAYIFTHEMSASQYIRRMICNLARVDYGSVDSGRLNIATEQRMREAQATLARLPIFIVDQVGVAPAQYIAALHYLVNRNGPGLVIIDYIQLEYEPEARDTRAAELARICMAWRSAMMRTHCACLMVAQLNRGAAGKPPELHDFRDSGAIEQEASAAILLYRPGQGNNERPANFVELNLAKSRDGSLARTVCRYTGYCMRFDAWTPDDRQLTNDEWVKQESTVIARQRDGAAPLPAPPELAQGEI